jgi:hypothetical protein
MCRPTWLGNEPGVVIIFPCWFLNLRRCCYVSDIFIKYFLSCLFLDSDSQIENWTLRILVYETNLLVQTVLFSLRAKFRKWELTSFQFVHSDAVVPRSRVDWRYSTHSGTQEYPITFLEETGYSMILRGFHCPTRNIPGHCLNPLKPVLRICTTHFNIQQLCIFSTWCIYDSQNKQQLLS